MVDNNYFEFVKEEFKKEVDTESILWNEITLWSYVFSKFETANFNDIPSTFVYVLTQISLIFRI